MSTAAITQAKQVQKVYSEWCIKATEIILASRIDDPGIALAPQQAPSTSTFSGLMVTERFGARKEEVARPEFFQLRSQRSFQVELYQGCAPQERAPGADEAGRLFERWTFSFFPANVEPTMPDRQNQTLVRKLNVTLRSLHCYARLLPGHTFCRSVKGEPLHWRFHVEGWPPTARGPPAQELVTHDFVSLQSSVGALRLSVSYRKELKATSTSGQFRGASSYGAQSDQIEVEEGYFADAAGSSQAAADVASLGRLGKIAEEPDTRAAGAARRGSEGTGDEQPPRPAAPTTEVPSGAAKGSRMRLGSEESIGSCASASSRGCPQPSAVDSTPGQPPAQGLAGPAAHGGATSSCSSRSPSPRTSPQLRPAQDPSSGRGAAALVPMEAIAAAAEHKSATGVEPRSLAAHAAGGGALGLDPAPLATLGSRPGSPSLAPAPPPGELDDLSNIWMRCPPEWRRHGRAMSLGSASRGTGTTSRSLSPEDVRSSAMAGATAVVDSLRSPGEPRGSGVALFTAPQEEGEICMFGMSDNEDDDDELGSEDGEGTDHNVVASAMGAEGCGGGGAFAVATAADPARLGLAGVEVLEAVGRPSSSSSCGDVPASKLSPLIAQLNPFMQPPAFDLPPAEVPLATEDTPQAAADAVAASAPDPGELAGSDAAAGPDAVQALLVEMGDLVCKLQQRKELAITAQEASQEELLVRLAHFREAAAGLGVDLHMPAAAEVGRGTGGRA